ncbi:MAG TPA: hypothetical protein PKI19_04385 [Elusimicrobiales bacterium]|nr:hypothetical protein [Elusimicrobiales bacterium]
MVITRVKLIITGVLVFIAAGGVLTWFQYRKITNYISEQVSGQAAKKLGRQIKFSKVSFSFLEGVTVEDACVSRRPDFSKGNFFCAARVLIRPKATALLKNKVYFSKVVLERPVLKVREENGAWDFADLMALIPETDKGLYLTWNASELVMKDAVLEADLKTSGVSLSLENASLTLKHYSAFGGNYGLETAGLVRYFKSAEKGKLLSAEVSIDAEANFDYGGLASTKGKFTAADATYGAIALEKLAADWSLFNLRKTLAEKNYSINLTAEKLLVPGLENSVKDSVSKGLAMFAAAMGKPEPKIDDIEMSSLKVSFKLDDSVLSIGDIALRTNFMNLDSGISINGPAGTADASLEAEIGANKLKMSASGPMTNPEIKPLLASTLAAKFKQSLAEIEAALLQLFPVTLKGETNV